MDPRVNQRVSPNRVAFILVLLLAAWLVFQFYPRKKPIPPFAPVAAESKLRTVGLADNPDWAGLPDHFAIWAGSAKWVGNRTYFAYWNPGSYSYSYFFEATRDGDRVGFRSIASAKSIAEGLYFGDEELAQYAGSRQPDSPTHPFVFPDELPTSGPLIDIPKPHEPVSDVPPKVEIGSLSQPITQPKIVFPGQPNVEPKK